jgi:hypothetical protein
LQQRLVKQATVGNVLTAESRLDHKNSENNPLGRIRR